LVRVDPWATTAGFSGGFTPQSAISRRHSLFLVAKGRGTTANLSV
jgi:hypothetical protein